MTSELPGWLPEWIDAESIAARQDTRRLREDVQSLVDYVFADDTAVLDSLPEEIESAIVTPLSILADINSRQASDIELVVAARLVRRSVEEVAVQVPPDLAQMLSRLPA